jgi:hypothetical protein
MDFSSFHFFGTVHINARDVMLKILSQSANSIELGQEIQMCRLAWLYTGGMGLSILAPTSCPRVNINNYIKIPLNQKWTVSNSRQDEFMKEIKGVLKGNW